MISYAISKHFTQGISDLSSSPRGSVNDCGLRKDAFYITL